MSWDPLTWNSSSSSSSSSSSLIPLPPATGLSSPSPPSPTPDLSSSLPPPAPGLSSSSSPPPPAQSLSSSPLEKKILVPVRYLEESISNLYSQYSEVSGSKISESTFRKYISKRYKKPKKATDLCHLCEIGKELEQYVLTQNNNVSGFKNKLLHKFIYII